MMKDFFKKNRGKKGFVMMEVLAVTVVILVIFTTIFTMFMPTEGEYEQRIDYNHVSAQYAAFYMRKIYIDEEIDYNGSTFDNNASYITLYDGKKCTNLDEDKEEYCESLAKELDLKEVILTTYNISKLKEDYTGTELKDYINYLPNYDNYPYEKDEVYRLIVKTGDDYYASMPLYTEYQDRTITIKQNPGGSLTVYNESKNTSSTSSLIAQAEDIIRGEATTNPGWTFQHISYDNNKTLENHGRFIMEDKDTTIEGIWIQNNYDIIINKNEGGNVSIFNETQNKANATDAHYQDSLEIRIDVLDGYELESVSVKTASGDNVTLNDYKFTMPLEDVTVTVRFVAKYYDLIVDPTPGSWRGTNTTTTIHKQYKTTETIENPTVPSYTINFNANLSGANLNKTSATYSKAFDKWLVEGPGTLNGTTYTFGAGNGRLTAQYKDGNAIALATASRTGYTFLGWYTEATGGTRVGGSGENYVPSNITGNITLYGHWEINEYTLTVNPNGGRWNNTTATSSFTQNYGTTKEIANPTAPSYTITFNANLSGANLNKTTATYTKAFDRWNLSGSGSLSGTTYTFGAGNGTLTAQYKNGNAITLATASRTGYTFLGWYTSATGGTRVGGSGGSYLPTNITGNITLYGHWEINEYTLTVNPNGGRWNNTTANSTFTQNYGTTRSIANPTAPSYTITFNANLSGANLNKTTATYSKAFDKWNLSGSGSLSGTTYTFGAGNGTLTAQYKNGNAITLATASRTGYTFLGWYTSATGGTKVGDSGGTYLPTNITGNMTLYGHWEINDYTLTVNPNGGRWNNTTANSTFTQNYGTTKSIANPTAPSYTITFNANLSGANLNKTTATYSKAFDKWNLSGSGSFSGTTYTFGAGNGTLTAQYKNGSAITLATASATGYKFLGWYTEATGGTKVGDSGGSYLPTNITGNMTLYGHWERSAFTLTVNPNGGRWNNTTANSTFTQDYGTTKEIANPTAPSYTITFNANLSGANLNKTTATYSKAFDKWNLSGSGSLSGTTYTFGAGNGTLTAQYKNGNAITLATASRTGYTFLGWYTAASGGTKVGDSGGSYLPTNITGNMTLYGHWQINSYTVTYDYTHNTFSTDTITNRGITSKVYQYNSAVDLTPKATRTSTRQGDVSGTVTWEWVGWNTDPNATTALTSYTMPANNVTLYAIYRIRPTYIARFDKTVNEYTNIDSCMRTYNDLEKCLTEGIAHNDFQNVSCTINSYAYNTQWTPGSSFNSQTCTVTSPTIEQDLVEIAGESEIITSIYYGVSDYSQSQAFSATGHNHYKFRKTKYGTSYYVFNGWNTNKNAVSGVTGNITISGDDLYYPTTSHNTFKIYLMDPYYTGLQEYYEPEHYNKSWGDPQNLHNMGLKKIEGPDGTNYIPLNSNGYITSVNGGDGFTNVRCNQNWINPKQMDCSSGTCVYEDMNYKLWKWDELTIYGWSDVGASVGGSYIDVNSNAVIARMKLRPIGTESTSTTCGYASNSEEFVFVQAFYVTEDDINSVYPDPHTGKTSYQCYCEGSIHTFNF